MKNIFILASIVLMVLSCTNKPNTKQGESNTAQVSVSSVDSSLINVYYFHGKQRCKTCVAVGDLAKRTIENAYANNDKVKFTEIDTSNKEYASLVEKYEVSWNALIIAKGDKFVDLTERAFANAVNSPDVLESLIKEEVNKNI